MKVWTPENLYINIRSSKPENRSKKKKHKYNARWIQLIWNERVKNNCRYIEGHAHLKYLLTFLLIYLFYFILYAHVQEYQMYKDHKKKLRIKERRHHQWFDGRVNFTKSAIHFLTVLGVNVMIIEAYMDEQYLPQTPSLCGYWWVGKLFRLTLNRGSVVEVNIC